MKKTVDFVGADLAICSDRPTRRLIDQGCRRLLLPRSIRGGIVWGVEKGILRVPFPGPHPPEQKDAQVPDGPKISFPIHWRSDDRLE